MNRNMKLNKRGQELGKIIISFPAMLGIFLIIGVFVFLSTLMAGLNGGNGFNDSNDLEIKDTNALLLSVENSGERLMVFEAFLGKQKNLAGFFDGAEIEKMSNGECLLISLESFLKDVLFIEKINGEISVSVLESEVESNLVPNPNFDPNLPPSIPESMRTKVNNVVILYSESGNVERYNFVVKENGIESGINRNFVYYYGNCLEAGK